MNIKGTFSISFTKEVRVNKNTVAYDAHRTNITHSLEKIWKISFLSTIKYELKNVI